jgi:hypothetical protein
MQVGQADSGRAAGVVARQGATWVESVFACLVPLAEAAQAGRKTSYVASKHRFTCRNRYNRQRVYYDNFKRRLRVFFKWNRYLATRCISRRRLPRWRLPGSLLSWTLPSWRGRCCQNIFRATLRLPSLRTVLLIGHDW